MVSLSKFAMLAGLSAGASWESNCFKEGEMFGFDVKNRGTPVEASDAEMLWSQGVMLEDTKPWAIRSCFDDS